MLLAVINGKNQRHPACIIVCFITSPGHVHEIGVINEWVQGTE